MADQHHGCNEHELRQTQGDGEGQGGLEFWGWKKSDTTGRLNNNNITTIYICVRLLVGRKISCDKKGMCFLNLCTPLQYSRLVNPMDGGAWWAAVHGVDKSQTRLSDFTLTFHFHALEKAMATHSSVLAWRIPGMGKPGGLPSMGSHRVRHDWSDLVAAEDYELRKNI